MDKTVDGYCSFFSCSNGVDREFGTCHDISACEYVRFGCLAGLVIHKNIALLSDLHSACYAAHLDLLPDRGENAVAGDRLVFLCSDRTAASLLVRLAESHLFDSDLPDLIFADDLYGRDEEIKLYAFSLSLQDLILSRRHLFAGTAVQYGRLRSKADCCSRHVKSDISSAHDHCSFSDLRPFTQVYRSQEIYACPYTRQIISSAARFAAL